MSSATRTGRHGHSSTGPSGSLVNKGSRSRRASPARLRTRSRWSERRRCSLGARALFEPEMVRRSGVDGERAVAQSRPSLSE